MFNISLACYFLQFDKCDVISHLHTVTGRTLTGNIFNRPITVARSSLGQKRAITGRNNILTCPFIRRIREIREKEPHRKIVYTNETWINENHRLKKEWIDMKSIRNPYRSLKDFGTVGETKEKCGKRKRLIIIDAITAEGQSKMRCGYFKHQKHLRKKSKRDQSIRKKLPQKRRRRQKACG